MIPDERILREPDGHQPDDSRTCLMAVRGDSPMRVPGKSGPPGREGRKFPVRQVAWSFSRGFGDQGALFVVC